MTNLILRLFFHGLVAFVPGDASGSMTAYTVIHAEHSPTLAFELKGRTKCPKEPEASPVCVKEEDSAWCVCNITGFDLTFAQPALGAGQQIGNKINAPTSQSDAGDSAWLVRLGKVNNTKVQVDPSKIASETSSSIGFRWLSERSCHLDQVGNEYCYPSPLSGCKFEIQAANFLHEKDQSSLKQALAEYAFFELKFLANFVTVVMSERKKGGAEIRIDLDCEDGLCPDLLIGNSSSNPEQAADSETHFQAYYNLAYPGTVVYTPYRDEGTALSVGGQQLHNCSGDPFRRRKELLDERLPEGNKRRKYVDEVCKSKKTEVLDELNCLIVTAAETRIICPMAMFDR